MFSVITNSG